MKKGIVYYTCNSHLPEIDLLCRKYLSEINLPIVSVSLNKPIDFGTKQIVLEGEKGALMMHRQILAGLVASDADYVFLAENDVIYNPSHFDFVPVRDDVYYYNTNVWKWKWGESLCVRVDNSQQLSGLVANRQLLLNYFTEKLNEIERKGFDRHFEPKGIRINYESTRPNICIRHDNNFSVSKWSPKDYRNKEYAKGWRESTIEEVIGYKP